MTQQMKHLKTSLETTDDGNEDNRQQTQLFAKNSMDRFGDDLCALLVSYISLEDRFRLECVSKQFQRTVFGSVVDITLSDEFIIYLMSGTLINTQLLATIARKFTNIGSIDCREITYGFYGKISHMLKTFRDNCRHLREIYATIWQMHSQWMHPFESLVTTISYTQREPNLRYSLTTYWSQLVKNLHTIELNDYSAQNNRLLAAFAAQNQSIRSVVFYSFERPIESTLVAFGQPFSRLTQLQELTLNLRLMNAENSLSESLRTIGLNCKQLQRLTLTLQSYYKLNGNSLDSLNSYHKLKRLDLTLNDVLNAGILEPLKLCHRLTHLALNILEMSNQLLDNCGKHWPRLQYLSIKSRDFSSECLKDISRLPALQTLVVEFPTDGYNFNDNALNAVLSSSLKLKTIEIRVNNEKKFYSK